MVLDDLRRIPPHSRPDHDTDTRGDNDICCAPWHRSDGERLAK